MPVLVEGQEVRTDSPAFNAAHDAALAAADPAQQAPGWNSVCLAAIVRP